MSESTAIETGRPIFTASTFKTTKIVLGEIVIHLDGRVELPEGADIGAVAKQFWDAVAEYAGISQEPFISGMRLPGEKLPKIHPDYATDGLTEPLKPITPMNNEFKRYDGYDRIGSE